MKLVDFGATADLVGRRIRIAWDVVPEGTETVADAPAVKVRRKLRDFDFPTPDTPFVIYDSASFPPAPSATLTVTDLPGWEEQNGAMRTSYSAISIAASIGGGRYLEIMRRTVGVSFDAMGVAVRQHVEILDLGGAPGALVPGRVYYYEIHGPSVPPVDDLATYRTACAPTESFGINRTLYDMLPAVYKRHDVATRPDNLVPDSVPEAARRAGQLRRFVDLFGIAADSLRGTAESLRNLHDVDDVDAKYLPWLARWIGWDLSFNAGVPLQRNEVKGASRLYRTVGTVPGLRAIVSQYTGWFTQVAEFAQHIARANDAPRYNLFASTERGAAWRGTDDASVALGFGPGNTDAAGSGLVAASLTSTVTQPYALRPGLVLTLAVDGQLPVGVRFESGDFVDIRAATAIEVAEALNRALHELTASVSAGRVVLTSNAVGAESSIRVEESDAGLVTLESAPGGKLSTFFDPHGRARLFYETTDFAAEATAPRRIRYKTLVDGVWRGSRHVTPSPQLPQASPTAIQLPAGPMLLAWVDEPFSARSRLRLVAGRERPRLPARLFGRRREPFAVVPGRVITLKGDFGTDSYTLQPGDFIDPQHVSATDLAARMNAQLTLTQAFAVNGALRIDSSTVGPRARLSVDLASSTTARAIGFGPENSAAVGSWEEGIDWEPIQSITAARPGWHDDPSLVADPLGGARLFWSRHQGARWQLVTARWDGGTWVATAGGVGVRSASGSWGSITTAAGLVSNDVRAVALDAEGAAWFGTVAGVSRRAASGAWTTFTTVDGLADNDVRAITIDDDGRVWFATDGGISVRRPNGAWTTFTTVDGLADNDTRDLRFGPDGTLWIATANGLSGRRANGSWITFSTPVAPNARGLAVDDAGIVWIATAMGLVRWDGARAVDVSETGTPEDVRGVAIGPDGTVWIATAAGVKSRNPSEIWRSFSTASGVASNDTRGITVGPDGSIWVATTSGLSVRGVDEIWRTSDTSNGLVHNSVRTVRDPWSSTLVLSTPSSAGDREPCAVVDGSNRTWVVWSQRQGVGTPQDTWLLRWRRFDPSTATWTAEAALTTITAPFRAGDREPGAMLGAGGGLRVFFRSDRSGGMRLATVDLSAGGVAGAPAALADTPANDRSPTPLVFGGGGPIWLLFRSDRNVALSQVSAGDETSQRVPDAGSIGRYAGSTSVVPLDIVRNGKRLQWGDLLSYTTQKPGGPRDAPLTERDYYTRGTIGLYVSRGRLGNPLTGQEVARMKQLLASFLPINVRAILIVAPSLDVEILYPPGADIGEAYLDSYPFVDYLTTLSDSTAAVLPGWSVLLSNTAGHVSADPTNLATLQHRSWHEPPI